MDLEWTKGVSREVEVGDRIKLVNMPDDPHPLEAGTEGTVTSVDKRMEVIGVSWDNGSRLNLVMGVDTFDLISEGSSDKAIINKSMPKPTLSGAKSTKPGKNLNRNLKSALKKGNSDVKVEDEVKGGLADKLTPSDIAKKHKVDLKDIQKEIEVGVEIEMEHTDDPSLAKEITLDHLTEFPDYYTNKEHGLKVSEKGLEGDLMENFFGGMGNAFGKKRNKDDQYDLEKLAHELKRITSTIKTSDARHEEAIVNMIENFRDEYSNHSMIDVMIKSLYQEVRELGQEIDETTSAGGSSGAFSGPLGFKTESKTFKVKDILEGTTTYNSGDYDTESKSPFDMNDDGWYWNDTPWFDGGEIVDPVGKLKTNWKDSKISLTKEELIKTVRVLEGKTIDEEELDEVDSTSSGQYSGPMFAAKDDESWNMGKKSIWKGGKIVQKVKNSGVLSEINKVKYNKDGEYVKFKDKCVKYNNKPHCSQGSIDNPLTLSKTTSNNITEVAKKLGISEKEVRNVVINKLSR